MANNFDVLPYINDTIYIHELNHGVLLLYSNDNQAIH